MAGRKITIEFLGKDSTSQATSAVEKRFGKLGSRLDTIGQRAGKALTLGFAAAGVAAVKLGQKASDLAETQSKVAQVFGAESTAALNKFAAGAAKSMGQSKQTALDGAATFGIIGKSAGLAGKDLVGFSTDMVKLAGDMASFNNSSPEEAIEAIGAGMRGEAEPLRRFGVLLDDATLRAQALKLGLIKTTKEALTPQQKALAAQAAILAQTSDQQGDFARTSEGLANKQRVLKAQLENLGTELGAKLLPAMVKVSSAGLKMIAWVDRNRTTVGVLVAVVGTLAAGLYAASVAMRVMTTVTALQAAAAKRAAAGQTAFGVSSVAMRGGALAAAAGLGVLAAKAGGAGTSMGALATVGAGLAAGFAVGGPWGAAIGGASGLLAVFTSRGNAAKESQARMKAAVSSVTATLNEQTGAMTKLTTTTVAKTLADTGAFTAARKVGVSYRDVLDAALGNEAATKRVDAATKKYLATNTGSISALQKASKTANTLTSAVHGTTSAIEGERTKINQVNSALGKLDGKTATVHVQSTGIGGLLNGLASIGNSLSAAIAKANKLKVGNNAKGTDNWRGGLTWVGEDGPELLNLPKGSQITPNAESEALARASSSSGIATAAPKFGGSGGGGGGVTIIVNGALDPDAVANQIRQMLLKLKRTNGGELGIA